MNMTAYEIATALILGVGLGAACGFRVFVPMLLTSIAVKAHLLSVSPGFSWLGSDIALAVFAAATVVEVVAYMIPWVDHLLDTMALPSAVVAGSVLSASFITGMDPVLKWTLAVVAGGGAAGAVQGTTMAVRGVASTVTFGLANPFISVMESIASFLLTLLVILAPVLAATLGVLVVLGILKWRESRRAKGLPMIPWGKTKPVAEPESVAAGRA